MHISPVSFSVKAKRRKKPKKEEEMKSRKQEIEKEKNFQKDGRKKVPKGQLYDSLESRRTEVARGMSWGKE